MSYFNSIKVRLEHLSDEEINPDFHYFNSIKVRLELILHPNCISLQKFQFHKGTIRTCLTVSRSPRTVCNFNSIKVRLEQDWFIRFLNIFNFNSIKVRLEPIEAFTVSTNNAFQFHKGTIRTMMFAICLRAFTTISIP